MMMPKNIGIENLTCDNSDPRIGSQTEKGNELHSLLDGSGKKVPCIYSLLISCRLSSQP